MSKRHLNLTLDLESMDRAIRYLEVLKGLIESRTETFVNKLCDVGYESAVPELAAGINAAEENGEFDLMDVQVEIETDGTSGRLIAEKDTVWIEFGTGVAANGSVGSRPHPKSAELGMSAIGTFGQGNGAKQIWTYKSPLLKRDRATIGIPCTPFMLHASQKMAEEADKVAREVFKP